MRRRGVLAAVMVAGLAGGLVTTILATPSWAAWTAAGPGVATGLAATLPAPAGLTVDFKCKGRRLEIDVAWSATATATTYDVGYMVGAQNLVALVRGNPADRTERFSIDQFTQPNTVTVQVRAKLNKWDGAWNSTSQTVGPC